MSQQNLRWEPEIEPNVKGQIERDRIREEYRARLAEKLKDPEFRKIEGFPIGTDEAILALSDPPYYTACPNPFIEEWLRDNAKPYDPAADSYHREPFAADVSEGKNDPIYNAHSYHTKVPHKAIMRYILHYTEPGDVVYDGFCGTGMTGVAAQMCGDKAQVESLGYIVDQEGNIWEPEAWKEKAKHEPSPTNHEPRTTTHDPRPFSKLGARKAILNDLSPAATFIAYNYNTPVDAAAFEREAKRVLKEVEEECGWMYSTLHDATAAETERIAQVVRQCQNADELRALYKDLQSPRSLLRDPGSKLQVGRINYTVWSDVFICPVCSGEIVFWDAAVEDGEVQEGITCPHCLTSVKKKMLQRSTTVVLDVVLERPIPKAKRIPVVVNFSVGKSRYEKKPDDVDLVLLHQINSQPIPGWYPTRRIDEDIDLWYERDYRSLGIFSVDAFYQRRNLIMTAFCRTVIMQVEVRLRGGLWFWFQSVLMGFSLLNRYLKNAFSQVNRILSGTLYVGAMQSEVSPWYALQGKMKRMSILGLLKFNNTLISTSSANVLVLSANSLDYIFTDPPFGSNIIYSDLNILWESWLGIGTSTSSEAVIHRRKKTSASSLDDFTRMMTGCFTASFCALKPGRWMTVEFHNSANVIYNSIQEALGHAGFILADVRVLDKQQYSFKQVTTTSATKQDLVISCYKPHQEFEERFKSVQGQPEGIMEFLRQHLNMLPVVSIGKNGKIEVLAERTLSILYDRMLAYHLQRGARIPLSAADFYRLLEEQFVERNEMYFLPDQAARYDAMKARGVETEQLSIFVRDEKTAVQWARSRLTEQPQTLGDLTPKFMQELREWESHEPRPELRDLLREYFIEDGGVWRVPDPDNEKDLEALRRNALLKLFRDYVNATGPLKVFRKEAVLEGFRHCWDTKQYGIITAICEKIPGKVLQEIHEFVQFYDIAKDLAPETAEQTAFVWD